MTYLIIMVITREALQKSLVLMGAIDSESLVYVRFGSLIRIRS